VKGGEAWQRELIKEELLLLPIEHLRGLRTVNFVHGLKDDQGRVFIGLNDGKGNIKIDQDNFPDPSPYTSNSIELRTLFKHEVGHHVWGYIFSERGQWERLYYAGNEEVLIMSHTPIEQLVKRDYFADEQVKEDFARIYSYYTTYSRGLWSAVEDQDNNYIKKRFILLADNLFKGKAATTSIKKIV